MQARCRCRPDVRVGYKQIQDRRQGKLVKHVKLKDFLWKRIVMKEDETKTMEHTEQKSVATSLSSAFCT